MRRLARTLAPWLLLAAFLTGCSTPGDEARSGPGDNGGSTTTTPPTSGVRVSGFRIDGLAIVPASGENRSLHEDDRAVIRFTVTNPQGEQSDYLVSYLLNGEVADVQTVRLAPGASRSFEYRVEDLRDLEPIRVEVRAGSERATAQADVKEWPRTGDSVDLGPVVVTVNRWLKNATDGGTDVNVTTTRKASPEGDYSLLRARALCVDSRGNVTTAGEARPNVPEPGASAMSDVSLPGCPDIIYGVEFTGKDPDQEDLYMRILFVDRGWRPPALDAA